MTKRSATARVERRKAPVQERLALVDDKVRERRRVPWLVILSLAFVFTVIFGVLFARVVLVKTSFKLQKIQENLAQAEELHEELMLEAAKMESPARIERSARAMGMVEPPTVNYIVADVPRRNQARFAFGGLPHRIPDSATAAAIGEESP